MNEKIHLSIIDDDDVYCFTTELLLRRVLRVFRISVFNNGSDAIQYLHKNHRTPNEIPDIVLLDINMPVMDGWQFLNELSSFGEQLLKSPCIYMVTSSIWPQDRKRAEVYPAIRGFASKPIFEKDFETIINNCEMQAGNLMT